MTPPLGSGGTTAPRAAMVKRYRTLWISDIHLGSKDAKIPFLLAFLRQHGFERIYIVGDFIDLLKAPRWYWPASHQALVGHLLKRAETEEIIYIPGNHDEQARQHLGLRVGQIAISRQALHTTADGRRLLVLHGDEFDLPEDHRLPCWLGSAAYGLLQWGNRWTHRLRSPLGFPYWSLANLVKASVPPVRRHIHRFERRAAAWAQRQGVDGIVCGHIHMPTLKRIGDVLYCNDGDWVESCTALVEHANGRLELLYSAEQTRSLGDEPSRDEPSCSA